MREAGEAAGIPMPRFFLLSLVSSGGQFQVSVWGITRCAEGLPVLYNYYKHLIL